MKRTSLDKEAGDEGHRAFSALLRRLGATRLGVWVIKHIVSPLDRWLYQRTGGRWGALGRPLGPLLLLTTTGRRTGKEHTTPSTTSVMAPGLCCAMSTPALNIPTPGLSTCGPIPLQRCRSGRSGASTRRARPARPRSITIGRNWCTCGPPIRRSMREAGCA